MDIDIYKTAKALHIIFLPHGWQGCFIYQDYLFITAKLRQKRRNTNGL